MLILLCSYWCSLFFFFFKQKTAYEMRISDWSSDVCSSDLTWPAGRKIEPVAAAQDVEPDIIHGQCPFGPGLGNIGMRHADTIDNINRARSEHLQGVVPQQNRSEEHTSEFQSLMRISYDVFCLKKKIHKQKKTR